jgi:hypothetical protein
MSQFGWRLCREVAKSMWTCKNKEIFKMLSFYPFTANRNLLSGHTSYMLAHFRHQSGPLDCLYLIALTDVECWPCMFVWLV